MPRSRWLLLMIAVALPGLAPRARAMTVTVPDDFATIQAAIDDPPFGTVDTIFVRPGVVTDSLVAYNLGDGLMVIGLGDSLSRPSIRRLLANTSSGGVATFANLRFTGLIRTVAKANLVFRDCRLEAGLTTIIDGDPRSVRLVGCRITGRVLANSDVGIYADSCWFDQGSIALEQDGVMHVYNSTFSGSPALAAVTASGDVAVEVNRNTIRDYGSAITVGTQDRPVHIEGNVVERCAAGINASGIVQVVDNRIMDCGGDGIRIFEDEGADTRIECNVIARSGRYGLYVQLLSGNHSIHNNTSYDNVSAGFAIVRVASGSTTAVRNNIAYRNQGYGLLEIGLADTMLACNDWFENQLGAVSGRPPSPTDLAVDPLFCDVDQDSVSLAEDSPLLFAPGCGLIGARGMGCASTPTLVSLFSADREPDGVRLRWQLAEPARFADVWVERSESISGPWARIAVDGISDGGGHDGLDRSALRGRELWYRLVAREGGRSVVIGAPIAVPAANSGRFELARVTPNPGFGPMIIRFMLPREAAVEVDVLDLQGRQVATVVRGTAAAGTHTVEWAAPSDASGVFFVEYRYPGGRDVQRVVRLN